ncbi:MAG: excinuclease ABC subunit UvrC [Bacilli bacterium]|nr:excinuclease ABC subunit UvrC [Bacilli bacterium]MDY5899217.1 excinuclease ABC subunit UvrC [Bacilli bacterium]
MNEILKMKIDMLPSKPGSYQMKDKNGNIIYVGKAKSLDKRVRQYFYRPQEGKVQRMVREIEDFDIIETNSEKEALLLEINLIQKYYPKYNILLKDGKMYPYISLRRGGDPFLKIAHNDKDKRYYYFGPFPSSHNAYTMINLLNKIFPLRKCNVIPKKPCLYYHLGQCLGPCINKIEESSYKEIVSSITKLLNGDSSSLVSSLTKKMKECSLNLDFERAKEYKDQIDSINHIISSQKIMMKDHIDRDVIGYSLREGYISVLFLLYRKGILLGKNLFVHELNSDVEDVLVDIIFQFYLNHPKPKEIVISLDSIKEVLEESLEVRVLVPSKGQKKDLLYMALENAKQGLDQHFQTARLEDDNLALLEELGKLLNIETPLDIELYDNSHLQGKDAIGALVKYINGVKVPSLYRKFNIKSENTKDDLSMMKEVLTRRLTRLKEENQKKPDLIILDGGEEQLKVAKEVVFSLGLDIALASLKKNEKHQTDTLVNGKDLSSILLDRKSNLFFLLMRMQDEVHRYAITTHKAKRSKEIYKTIYDDIKGIGKKRKEMLLSLYPTKEALSQASIEELKQIVPLEIACRLKEIK